MMRKSNNSMHYNFIITILPFNLRSTYSLNDFDQSFFQGKVICDNDGFVMSLMTIYCMKRALNELSYFIKIESIDAPFNKSI